MLNALLSAILIFYEEAGENLKKQDILNGGKQLQEEIFNLTYKLNENQENVQDEKELIESYFWPSKQNWQIYYEKVKPNNGYTIVEFSLLCGYHHFDPDVCTGSKTVCEWRNYTALLPEAILKFVQYFKEFHPFYSVEEFKEFFKSFKLDYQYFLANNRRNCDNKNYYQMMQHTKNFFEDLVQSGHAVIISCTRYCDYKGWDFEKYYCEELEIPPLGKFTKIDENNKFELLCPDLANDIMAVASMSTDSGGRQLLMQGF